MRAGIDGLHTTGHLLGSGFYLSLIADVERQGDGVTAALETLRHAKDHAERSGDVRHLSSIHREIGVVERIRGGNSARWLVTSARLAEQQGARLVLRQLLEE